MIECWTNSFFDFETFFDVIIRHKDVTFNPCKVILCSQSVFHENICAQIQKLAIKNAKYIHPQVVGEGHTVKELHSMELTDAKHR